MRLLDQDLDFTKQAGPLPVLRVTAQADQMLAFASATKAAGGRFVALWGADERNLSSSTAQGFSLHVTFALSEGLAHLAVPLPATNPEYPDLSQLFPAANRQQRATYDLLGIRATGDECDIGPWLRHANWPADHFPLRCDADGSGQFPARNEDYPFVRVEGDGVHEIAVGPIHAGIIEPGHFRFSVVGEKVLRLEERLGWVHKGIEKRFEQLPLSQGHRLAGRVSGDSTVAYAWAYCLALESLAGFTVPPRAAWLRSLFLERERVANHLGDLGYLGNDAALSFGLSQFMRLKEDWLRLNGKLFGHRLLMDRIVPGGAACDLDKAGGVALNDQCAEIEREVTILRHIYDEHAGLQDRFLSTGRLLPQLAAELSVSGLAGRASRQLHDLRVDHPIPPYDELQTRIAVHANGDVAARVSVRFDEVFESLRLIRDIVKRMPEGDIRTALPASTEGADGIGWIEGWRGDVLVALQAGAQGRIRRCHCHDPLTNIWPALEHAIMGNIVPDFPLINKSFNLSYSGQDL